MSKFGLLAQVVARPLDAIADLPVFTCPPPGTYKLLIEKCEEKEISKKAALVVEYAIVETVELTDKSDAEGMAKPGDKFSEAFWFNDAEKIEQTLSVLKAKFGGLATLYGTNNLLEILEKMPGTQVQAIITNRADKDDKTKFYPQTRDMVPAV